jgi:hypothetical protein
MDRHSHDTLHGILREALLVAPGPQLWEQLLGVGPDVLGDLVSPDVPVRVCVLFGHAWFRHWISRFAESGGA